MRLTFGSFAAAGVAAITAAAVALPANAATELKVTTALGSKHDQSTAFMETFAKKMKEDESEVTLKYLGGPEVTPPRKQGAAMKRGLIDIIMSPTTYYSATQPEARLTGISNVPPQEWRKNGGFEIMADAWAKRMNAIILGWGNFYTTEQFSIWLVDKPKLSKETGLDLKGMKVRSTALYTPFFKAMGAIPKTIDPAEVYTALESGTVRGLAWPEGGVTFRGWQRFIKYRIFPGFFRSTTMATMNKDKFESLSKKAQAQLLAAGLYYENNSGALLKAKAKIDNEKIRKAGVQDYHLKGEYAKAYIDTILGAKWADAAKRKYTVPFEVLKSKLLKQAGS
jgi:TRAP-type C4-dicarboxylate transport system substrate-binding protein